MLGNNHAYMVIDVIGCFYFFSWGILPHSRSFTQIVSFMTRQATVAQASQAVR